MNNAKAVNMQNILNRDFYYSGAYMNNLFLTKQMTFYFIFINALAIIPSL